MKNKCIFLTWVFAISCLSHSVLTAQTESSNEPKPKQEEAKDQLIDSIFSSCLDHTKMLERGDVIITLDETFEGINKNNEYSKLRVDNSRKSRLIFDFPKKRFLLVDFYSGSKTLHAATNGAKAITRPYELVRAVVFFDGECHARTLPDIGFEYADGPEKVYLRLRKKYAVPDLRQVGLTPFDSLSSQTYEEFEGSIH